MTLTNLRNDRPRRFRPNERLGIGVVIGNVVRDGLHEFANAWERTAADALGGDLCEKAFDGVQPGRGRWREVHGYRKSFANHSLTAGCL
jgi:hypothetical protein